MTGSHGFDLGGGRKFRGIVDFKDVAGGVMR